MVDSASGVVRGGRYNAIPGQTDRGPPTPTESASHHPECSPIFDPGVASRMTVSL